MAFSAVRGICVALFAGLGALTLHACAGDRLVLPDLVDSGSSGTSGTPGNCTQCGDECVDPMTDARHCGACANKCAAGSVCAAGKCSVTCPTGFLNCGG